jgi:hypothetical protein
LIFDLTYFKTIQHLGRLVTMIRYPPSSGLNPQSLYHGLVLAHEILFGASARPHSKKYLITVSAGKTAPNINVVSSGLRSEGVESFVIDLFPPGNADLLKLLSKPRSKHKYTVDMGSTGKLRRGLTTVASTISSIIQGTTVTANDFVEYFTFDLSL